MRVNVYAEEMTDRLEIITKEIDGQKFTGLRFYLELPVTFGQRTHRVVDGDKAVENYCVPSGKHTNVAGPFLHRPGDDDSSAVTFWGKRDLRKVLWQALRMLDDHYGDNHALENVSNEHLFEEVRRRGYSLTTGFDQNV